MRSVILAALILMLAGCATVKNLDRAWCAKFGCGPSLSADTARHGSAILDALGQMRR